MKSQAFLLQKKNYEKSSFFSDFRSREKNPKSQALFSDFFALGKKIGAGAPVQKRSAKAKVYRAPF